MGPLEEYRLKGYTVGPDRVKAVWDWCKEHKHPYLGVYTRRTHADFNYSLTFTDKELSETGSDLFREYVGSLIGPEKMSWGSGKFGAIGYKEGVVLQIPIAIAKMVAEWFYDNEHRILITVEDD